MTVVVEIEPVTEKPRQLKIVGIFTDDDGNVLSEKYKTMPFFIPENGITLIRGKKENDALLNLIENCKQLRPYFFGNEDGTNGSSQIFKIVNHENDAQNEIDAFDKEFEVMQKVKSMSDNEIKLFGLLFGFTGSTKVINANIIKTMRAGKKQLETVIAKINDPDRPYLEVIHSYLDDANRNPNANEGLRKTDGNVYSLNGVVIGVGIEKVIAYLKENDNLFADMKKDCMKDEDIKAAAKKAAAKK